MFKRIREDIDSVMQRDPAARSRLAVIFCYPGFHALLWYRVSHTLWRWGLRTLLARRARVHWLGLYRMDTNTDADRRRFLDEVAQRLRRLGS